MLFTFSTVASQMPTTQSQKQAAKAYFNSSATLRGGPTRLCRVDTTLAAPVILAAMAA